MITTVGYHHHTNSSGAVSSSVREHIKMDQEIGGPYDEEDFDLGGAQSLGAHLSHTQQLQPHTHHGHHHPPQQGLGGHQLHSAPHYGTPYGQVYAPPMHHHGWGGMPGYGGGSSGSGYGAYPGMEASSYGAAPGYYGHYQPALPSPAGSHNTPSPQAGSEDGEPDPRNNNGSLKRDYPLMNPPGGNPPYSSSSTSSSSNPAVAPPKKPKAPKRKKKRDPNEPQKPVSAYALFFRDSQANIKAANPNAAFGDVSKIVASMWDGLDPENKAAYKKRTENAKKEYLKKLAAYRASLVSKGNSPISESGGGGGGNAGGVTPSPYGHYGPPTSSAPSFGGPYGQEMKTSPVDSSAYPPPPGHYPSQPPQVQMHRQSPYTNSLPGGYMQQTHQHPQMPNGGGSGSYPSPDNPPPHSNSSSSPPLLDSSSSNSSRTPQTTTLDQGHLREGPDLSNGLPRIPPPPPNNNSNNNNPSSASSSSSHLCARPGCNNPISDNPAWEFCSHECGAGQQCRDVYPSWTQNNGGGGVQTQ
eukprot:TRINITY_DN205_c2_g1_i1.p1 TRINITY_DN205_c2_g1~~TRINITY_DN205_c2_g1_i1.p1  ORF type:complete len:525 (-),score=197.26 TRINITY_DN205_c2_g1_i1:482-2056(-)